MQRVPTREGVGLPVEVQRRAVGLWREARVVLRRRMCCY